MSWPLFGRGKAWLPSRVNAAPGRYTACRIVAAAGRTQRVRRHVACSTTSAGRTQRVRRHVACSTTSAGAWPRELGVARARLQGRSRRQHRPGVGHLDLVVVVPAHAVGPDLPTPPAAALYPADLATKAPRSDPGVGGDRREQAETRRDGLAHRAVATVSHVGEPGPRREALTHQAKAKPRDRGWGSAPVSVTAGRRSPRCCRPRRTPQWRRRGPRPR